jgi:HEAT repeat protein
VRKPSKFDKQLAELHGSPTPEAVAAALRSKNGILIAAAVRHATAPDALAEAFGDLLVDGAKRDPVCRGKVAIARALHDRDEWSELFEAGARAVQMEPALGGPVDTAGELRGICGLALAHFGRPEALDVLADLLADPEVPARIAAGQGLGDAGRPDASALLRFKLHTGDLHSEVIGACASSLLALQKAAAIEFVATLLDGEHAEAVALALAESRLPAAVPVLVAWADGAMPAVRRGIGYLALALTRLAHDHLLAIVSSGERADALAAAKALATFKDDPALCQRIRDAAPRALRTEIAALLA